MREHRSPIPFGPGCANIQAQEVIPSKQNYCTPHIATNPLTVNESPPAGGMQRRLPTPLTGMDNRQLRHSLAFARSIGRPSWLRIVCAPAFRRRRQGAFPLGRKGLTVSAAPRLARMPVSPPSAPVLRRLVQAGDTPPASSSLPAFTPALCGSSSRWQQPAAPWAACRFQRLVRAL